MRQGISRQRSKACGDYPRTAERPKGRAALGSRPRVPPWRAPHRAADIKKPTSRGGLRCAGCSGERHRKSVAIGVALVLLVLVGLVLALVHFGALLALLVAGLLLLIAILLLIAVHLVLALAGVRTLLALLAAGLLLLVALGILLVLLGLVAGLLVLLTLLIVCHEKFPKNAQAGLPVNSFSACGRAGRVGLHSA